MRGRSLGRRAAVAAASALTVGMGVLAPSADAVTYAPVDRPGPALSVPRAQLDAALRCPSLGSVTRDVVLLIPGTTVDPGEAFDWNYVRALDALGIPHCEITLPNHTDGDIQIAAEYVVDAVRAIHGATDRRVLMLGWSQGASTLPRWAIRFWPDIRPMISGLVGLAPLNNIGSAVATGACLPGTCIPAAWQQARGSAFMAALNSGQQTFPEIAYSAIYTRTDEVVTPNADGALSVLPPGPNVTTVAVQDLCPTDVSEHLGIVASPGAYALALDAIQRPGEPTNVARVSAPAVCLPGTMPGVDPNVLLTEEARIASNVPARLQMGAVDAEPPLRCYVTASCPEAPAGAGSGATGGTPATTSCRTTITLPARAGRRTVRAVVRVRGRRAQVLSGRRLRRVTVSRSRARAVTVRVTTHDDRGRTRTFARRLSRCR